MFRLLKISPPHGWRAVWWELGIVTLGVLVALAAQQWAEDRSSKHRAAAAEEAMALEIRNSLLANAELAHLDRCWDVQIRALRQSIVNGETAAAGRIVEGGSFFGAGRLWADNAFQAALTAQVSDYLGSDKLKNYSQVYDMIRNNRFHQDGREQTIAQLGTLTTPGLPKSPEITYSLLTALAQLQSSKDRMREQGKLIAMFAKNDLGLEIGQRQYFAARGRLDIIKACEDQARLAQQLTTTMPR